ncbi:SE1832 family protein [Mammaliicoccus sciuri]|nr:SE1832 family protein [Mammaliicoccus sciuri]
MDLNQHLSELKYDYIRIQNDLEKREKSTGQATDLLEKQLVKIEEEISKVRAQLDQD